MSRKRPYKMLAPFEAEGIIIDGLPATLPWLRPGTTLAIELIGNDRVLLTPAQSAGHEPASDCTIITGRTKWEPTPEPPTAVPLPDAIKDALVLEAGDRVSLWTEGKRIFIEKYLAVDENEEPVPKSQPRRQLYETLPRPALPLDQRRRDSVRRYGWAEEAGSARFDASLDRVPKPEDRPWRGGTWVATAHTSVGSTDGIPRDVRGEGKNIPQALGELTRELQERIRDLYIENPVQLAAAARGREPEADVRPVYPPEVETALERFRARWSTAAPEDRERVALRPAVLQMADLGLASVDIAWILQVDQEDVEAYVSNPHQDLFHYPKQETHKRPLP